MTNSLPATIAATLLAASLAAPSLAQSPDPDRVHVTSIRYEGTGCPQGSVGSSFSSDRESFTLIFDQFVTSTGTMVASTEAKKDCQVTLLLNVPSTFQGGELTFEYRGYSTLAAGLTGGHKRKYSSSKTTANTALVGAVARDYHFVDQVGFTKVKRCDGTPCIVAKIKTSLQKSDSFSQQVTVDSIDGDVTISN